MKSKLEHRFFIRSVPSDMRHSTQQSGKITDVDFIVYLINFNLYQFVSIIIIKSQSNPQSTTRIPRFLTTIFPEKNFSNTFQAESENVQRFVWVLKKRLTRIEKTHILEPNRFWRMRIFSAENGRRSRISRSIFDTISHLYENRSALMFLYSIATYAEVI